MAWTLSRRGSTPPQRTMLGTEHLDTITAVGSYQQTIRANATKSNGYPFPDKQCVITVTRLGTMPMQELINIDGRLAVRTQYQGVWSSWMSNGTAVA